MKLSKIFLVTFVMVIVNIKSLDLNKTYLQINSYKLCQFIYIYTNFPRAANRWIIWCGSSFGICSTIFKPRLNINNYSVSKIVSPWIWYTYSALTEKLVRFSLITTCIIKFLVKIDGNKYFPLSKFSTFTKHQCQLSESHYSETACNV